MFELTQEPWMEEAACIGHDPEMWFVGDDHPGRAEAKRICRGCPVREACLEYALRTETPATRYGYWGGMSMSGRDQLARRMKRGAA